MLFLHNAHYIPYSKLLGGLPHPGKDLDLFAVLESCWILFISPGKSLKISGRFPVLHQDRIVKLLSLIISTKN